MNATAAKYALLWDMDGTIVDDAHVHYAAWQHTFDLFGFTLDGALYKANFGRNNRVLLPLLLGYEPTPQRFDQLVTVKENPFQEACPGGKTGCCGCGNLVGSSSSCGVEASSGFFCR